MSGVNRVILAGQIADDPDYRSLNKDVAVANFTLATFECHNKNGAQVEQTELHKITMWRTLAESAAKTLKKGNNIYLEGKARTRSFVDNLGIKRYVTEIVADNFRLMDSTANADLESSGVAITAKN